MLHRYLSDDIGTEVGSVVRAIQSEANDPARIEAPLHNFYKYPACFPPGLIRKIISSFSEPGDLVLDPFVGGGTTALEALLLKRAAVGIDINDLSIFSCRLKMTPLTRGDVRELDAWATECSGIRPKLYDDRDEEEEKLFQDIPASLSNLIKAIRAGANELESKRAKTFALGMLLNSTRALVDGRKHLPTTEKFLQFFQNTYEGCLEESLKFSHAIGKRRLLALIKGDCTSSVVADRIRALRRPARLLVTSPPYPGISVLYNRWQINGRRETTLPYWIIGSRQDKPASFYTMGHPKTQKGEESYFRTIRNAFGNVRTTLRKGTLVVQVVAFGDKRSQLNAYLDAMEEAGYNEIRNLTRSTYDGRLWRPVSNRRWYNNLDDASTKRQEVIFFYRSR